METPNKMIGGIAGAMAQQTGVLGGAANLGVQPQPQPGAMSVAPQQPPSVFNNNSMLAGQGIYGQKMQGAAFRMEGDSPIDQNAFFAALQSAKESGAKTFNVGDKKFPVK